MFQNTNKVTPFLQGWTQKSIVLGLLLFVFLIAYCFRPLPERLSPPASLELYSENGQRLATFRDTRYGSFRFALSSTNEYPKDLQEMLLFSEDRHMSFHPGVDPIALFRAAYQNLKHGRIVSGASTIAMQLVRILYEDKMPKNPWLRKIVQIYYALRLSLYHTDDTLLLSYLNTAPLPANRRGFAAAAVYLFGRDISLLNQEEKALLVVLLRSSSVPRPILQKRLQHFLDAFHKYTGKKHISPKAKKNHLDYIFNSIYKKKAHTEKHISQKSPHFVLFIKNRFPWLSGPLTTTLNANWNEKLSEIIQNEFPLIEKTGAEDAAVVVLERTNLSANPQRQVLKLRALLGSRNFQDPKDGQINGALVRRNAGSSLKPFVYGLAFDRLGLRPWNIIEDTEVSFLEADGSSYRPRNYDLRFWGALSIREALATSRNIPAVKLAHRLKPVFLHSFFQKAGFQIDPDPKRFGSGLALGTAGARLIESCRAFASLAARGWLLPLVFAKKDKKLLYLYTERRQLLSEGAAWYVTDILSDRTARKRSFGERSFLDFPFPVAAKTGTSKDYKDSWTIGYTPRFVVGVWVGRFSGGPMQGLSGAEGAGRIFQQAMRLVAENAKKGREFKAPAGWQEIEVCPASGLRGRSLCPAHREWVPPTSPILENFCPRHLGAKDFSELSNKDALAALSEEMKNKTKNTENKNCINQNTSKGSNELCDKLPQEQKTVSSPLGPVTKEIQILSPLEGEVYYLDPHTPQDAQGIPFQIHFKETSRASEKGFESPIQAKGKKSIGHYSWRINGGPWQNFSEGFTRTLSLRPGNQQLQVRLPSGKILIRRFMLH